jgi:hypothetical protein
MINIGIAEVALIIICTLIFWGIAFLISYYKSPYAMSIHSAPLIYLPRTDHISRIYDNIKPDDHRSRAIFCLITSSELTITLLLAFIACLLWINITSVGQEVLNIYCFFLLIFVILEGVVTMVLIEKLVERGIIVSIES